VAPPACTLTPTLARQPAHAGTPATLPAITGIAGLPELRACFHDTLRHQAWTVYDATDELEPTHHFTVGGVHFLAHENNVEGTPVDVLTAYVDALADAGVTLVGIHMGAFPWLCTSDTAPGCTGATAVQTKYDAVMGQIATRGLRARLMLPITDSVRFPMSSWNEYRDAMLAVVAALLDRYGASALSQVGMHEPSSVEALIVRASDPDADLDPMVWRDELVDPVCALADAAGVACTATLIPGPASSPLFEWRFIDAAITSDADQLGVNNIHLFGLEPQIVAATDDFIARFETGALTTGGNGPARGPGTVFFNATWRGAWPMTTGEPVASNAAGVGCAELDPVDDSYLGALFAWARARRLASVTVFYTTSFIARHVCDRDPRMFASVESSFQVGQTWSNFQQGNAISDPEYRLGIYNALRAPTFELTDVGEKFRALAELARGEL
jgi:hypothetical protein